jgi:hypothetical protein
LLSVHIGTDLKTVLAATRKVNPSLSFDESWNLLRHQRPELFATTVDGFKRTELVQAAVGKPTGKPDLKAVVCAIQRKYPWPELRIRMENGRDGRAGIC